MKINVSEIIRLVASKRARTPEHISGISDIKGLLSMSLEKSLYLPEGEELVKALNNFRQSQMELSQEIEKSSSGIRKQLDALVKQYDVLRKKKTVVASKISEVLASGGTPEDLYAQIYKITSDIRQLDDVVRTLEKESKYPSTEEVQKLGEAAFGDYVNTVEKFVQFNKALAAYNSKTSFIYDIMDVYAGQLQNLQTSFSSAERSGIQLFNFVDRSGIQMTWAELETAARAEIEKRLKGGASK
ncbi:MAG: hypothetical protein UU63_C0006G0003 [Candidatus Uhrbacteria bacterium GW2011_GWF2_41_430]|nr:MAG: hypothetical protein UU63_C0006G0003 [Candidatus Uhrbacteria bacterium GW2011_GWF2_41_430]